MMKADVMNDTVTMMKWLEKIPDRRDNRGKRHRLSFVLAGVILAILSNRSYLSSIHRFLKNKLDWLQEMCDCPDATAVSRAQLPNILSGVDWDALNAVFEEVFAVRIVNQDGEWKAIDGKSLKGTIVDPASAHQHERIVIVAGQTSHDVLHQQRFSGDKESEVTVVRELLEKTGLVNDKISLDAGHAYPDTLGPIHQAGGLYVVQVKGNQPQLFKTLADLAAQVDQMKSVELVEPEKAVEAVEVPAAGVVISTIDNAHGRLEERVGRVLSLAPGLLHERWESTGMQTLIVMDRDTEALKTGHISAERSYYVSNHAASGHERELFDVIRGHWRIESINWIRDVTFNEDHVRTQDPNTGQILSLLRTIALQLLQHLHPPNMKAKLEEFADRPDALRDLLVHVPLMPVSSRA